MVLKRCRAELGSDLWERREVRSWVWVGGSGFGWEERGLLGFRRERRRRREEWKYGFILLEKDNKIQVK